MTNSLSNKEPIADILIVDDVPVNLQLLSSMLLETGYKVRQAVNGPQALKALEIITPDLILLDIMMPDMTGYEVCKQLKESEKTKHIPVIFMSALDDVFDKVLAFDVGGADYITKPFRVQEVVTRVQNQLALRQQEKNIQAQYNQLQQKICDLKIEEEDLSVYLHAIAKYLYSTTNHTAITLKDLLQQTQQQAARYDIQGHNTNEKKEPLAFSSTEIRVPIQAIRQIINNCDQQLTSINTIIKLVDPKKLN